MRLFVRFFRKNAGHMLHRWCKNRFTKLRNSLKIVAQTQRKIGKYNKKYFIYGAK